MRNFFYIATLFATTFFYAQEKDWENPNYREITVENQRIIPLGEISIIPESVVIYEEDGKKLEASEYFFNDDENTIELSEAATVKIEFYVFPDSITQTFYKRDTALIIERYDENQLYELSQGMDIPKKSAFDQVKTEGSLVRGLSFGNNQGASVQSSLNLTMDGKLSDNLNIKANLSDYNIPIEQNGYTQQINEFENISMSIYNDDSSLNAGFLTLKQDQSYFANFEKRLTGVQVNTRIHHAKSFTEFSGTGSISRGQFNRIRFQAIEGNQGPYRLRGLNNENFIIVIPYSEKVYIDGLLLERGEEADYVISYNTGEITFTGKRLITGNDRIVVEYQYTALSYNRFLVYGKINHQSEKFQIQGTVYSESDSKNSPKDGDLTDMDKQVLAEAGNNENLMFVDSATQTEYSDNRILYELVNDGTSTFYQYSTDPEAVLYNVSFTFVGANSGNYIKDNTTLNGKVYSYVPPIGGVSQGNYAATRRLVAPTSQQVYALDSKYKLNNGGIQLNMALSNDDKNTFSKIDDGQNAGYALRGKFFQNLQWNEWQISPAVEYSFIQQNFYIIDRINKIEFNRDYNLNTEFDHKDQQQLKFDFATKRDNLQFDYALHFLNRKGNYKGNTQYIDLLYQPNKTRLISNILLHNDDNDLGKAALQDYKIEAQRTLGKNILAVGTKIRNQNDDYTDEFLTNKLDNQRYYIKNIYTDSLNFNYGAEIYFSKNDTLRYQRDLYNKANGIIFNTSWRKDASNGIAFDAHFRDSDNDERISNTQFKEQNLLSNLKINKSAWKDGLLFNFGYQLGSGSEPQREFQYVEVSDGNGIYKWTDYNGDGIQEIDEFEIAEFQDLANYVRVYTNTVNYLKTVKNGFELGLNFIPSKIWNTDFAKRWKIRANYQTTAAFLKNDQLTVFNPFETKERRYLTENFITDIGFNNLNQNKYEIRYRYFTNDYERNDYLGIESILKKSHEISISNRLWQRLILENRLEFNLVDSYSERLQNKVYKVPGREYQPSLTYEFLKELKIKGYYQYVYRFNEFDIQKLFSNELGLEMEYYPKDNTILASFSYVNNRFEGDAQSLIGNQMMQGLKVGKNLIWQLSIQNKLASFLYLNISYQGRKTEENRAIHIGNAQVKFVF